MSLRDNEMNRSITQALYKYLPEAWGDFYVKATKEMYTTKIRDWNSQLLIDVNETRLLEKIKNNLNSFVSMDGKVSGFGDVDTISEKTYEIRTPMPRNVPDIFTEISPLVFTCSQCNKVIRFKSSAEVSKARVNLSRCHNKPLKQIQLIYSCKCGWAGPVEIIPCKEHGFEYMKYSGDFKFICTKCGKNVEMTKQCPVCNSKLYSKPALDNSHFIPFSISSIDLINMDEEKFLSDEGINGAKVIMAYWLSQISTEDYNKLIREGITDKVDEMKKSKYDDFLKVLLGSGMSEEQAKELAWQATYKDGNSIKDKIEKYFDSYINLSNENIILTASNILEYYRILKGSDIQENKEVITLEDAKSISKLLKTSTNYDKYDELLRSAGIRNIQASNNVPLISCTYGYTRQSNSPSDKVVLKAFPAESKNKKNVYAIKLKTEGILIDIDRKMILEWLIKNDFISENLLPKESDMNDEDVLKAWFINNINIDGIKTFQEIDKQSDSITYYVYNLLHSISHALLKEAGELCGLDKNSLLEYIFPQIPSIFIYCQNSQGLSLGALTNLFEAHLDKWIIKTLNSVEKCVFDPACSDKYGACAGCLYTNEISCTHFNKDLNRNYLTGHFDKNIKKKLHGFWEEAIKNTH